MLQNLCEKSKEKEIEVPKVTMTNKDYSNQKMNIRREPTQREKIEMEMKKWSKQVYIQLFYQQVEKKKNIQHQINEVVNVDIIQKEEYDKVIPIESFEPEKEKKEENVSFICYICQRKFPNEEKLKLHEMKSELHKKNLEKQKQQQQINNYYIIIKFKVSFLDNE